MQLVRTRKINRKLRGLSYIPGGTYGRNITGEFLKRFGKAPFKLLCLQRRRLTLSSWPLRLICCRRSPGLCFSDLFWAQAFLCWMASSWYPLFGAALSGPVFGSARGLLLVHSSYLFAVRSLFYPVAQDPIYVVCFCCLVSCLCLFCSFLGQLLLTTCVSRLCVFFYLLNAKGRTPVVPHQMRRSKLQ
jgi:hypothetical protein